MPYKCEGANLMHEKGGKWSVKQHCDSHQNCIEAMQLLQGLEHGTIKPSQVGKGKYAEKHSWPR